MAKNAFTANYIIVNDGISKKNIEKHKLKSQLIVSHRLIDYCIDNRKFVNLYDKEFIHLLPLPFKVPMECFANVYIHFDGFNIIEKNILELLAETLGAKIELNR